MKSKESNEVLKSTILNMSHDLRTPLTSIQGYLQLINMEEIDAYKRKEYIKIIEARIDSLKNMMESFFELAKVESNTFPIELKVVNTYDLFVDTLGMYYDLDLIENIFIIADEKALKRIFDNLISNIVKHGCQKASIKNEVKEDELIYVFKNNTYDINDENVGKLFDKFYTTSNSRTEKSSGLGLTITKELVFKINGEIEVKYHKNEINFILKFNLYKNKL